MNTVSLRYSRAFAPTHLRTSEFEDISYHRTTEFEDISYHRTTEKSKHTSK